MERKQLVERLERMKKELARKQQKLEKANRAAKVKAHVKQKILEHNHQSGHENKNGVPAYSFSSRESAVLFEENKPPASSLSLQRKRCFTNTQSSAETSNYGRARDSMFPLNPLEVTCTSQSSGVKKLDNASIKIHSKNTIEKDGCHTQENSECKSVENSHEHEFGDGIATSVDMGRQAVGFALEVDDSLAITPSFKSVTETGLMHSHPQDLLPEDLYDSNFTLNLHTEATVDNKDTLRDTQADDVSPVLMQDIVQKNITPSSLVLSKTVKSRSLASCDTVTSVNESHTAESDSQTPSKKMFVPHCKENTARLKLQDIGSVDVASQEASHSQSQEVPQQAQDKLFDYTELDVIPFSQFELTEDFLSEDPNNFLSSRQGKGRRKSLVQRKSPRLSWFEFTNSDRSAPSAPIHHSTSQQSNLFKMARKQKKTKKALLLSSLFQFLIDEAKREVSFVEFQLPDDIATFVSCCSRLKVEERLQNNDSFPCASAQRYVVHSQDVESIPETELTPEFENHRLCNTDSDLKTEESLSTKEVRGQDHESSRSDTVSHSDVKLPGVTSECAVSSKPSAQNGAVCNSKIEEHRKESETSATEQNQNSGNHTQPKTCSGKRTNKKPLKLKQEVSSQERSITKDQEMPVTQIINRSQQKLETNPEKLKLINVLNSQKREQLQKLLPEPAESPVVNSTYVTLPSTPKMDPQSFSTDAFASPVLFGTELEINRAGEIGNELSSSLPGDAISQVDLKGKATKKKPVFTPSKSKPGDKHENAGDDSWITYAGCAESGSKDAVVDTVVGMATPNGEETAFILSVQTTALTLWTLDDKQQWSAEFYWYLPQTSRAQGACRIHTCDDQLTALVWGVGVVSLSPFLMVFLYDWDTQHTQRFSLPLPSHIIPERLFCHGLQASVNTVLVFATDKAYTRGKKYVVDRYQNCVGAELAMQEVNTKLVDLRLVEGLADAAVGLAEDQRLFIWNHMKGIVILSMFLPSTIPVAARMFSCHSFQGYLLFHTVVAEASREVCLVAVSPTAAAGKVVRQFTSHFEDASNWKYIVDNKDVLLGLNQEGKLHMWDACSTQPLISMVNDPGKICTAHVFYTRQTLWLLAGQENGCLHMYSVTP